MSRTTIPRRTRRTRATSQSVLPPAPPMAVDIVAAVAWTMISAFSAARSIASTDSAPALGWEDGTARPTMSAKAKAVADMVGRAVPSSHPSAGALSVEAIERAAENADIIVHATAATMSTAMGGAGGNTDWLVALVRRVRRGMVVLDMVYTPTWTALLQAAKSNGARAVSGLSLLVF